MAEKILKTRIQLRYDTLENWARNNPVLKAGEIAIVTIPDAVPADKQLPPVMFKVGTYDGVTEATKKKFNELDWASGLAADVYDWAKAATKPSYSYDEISGKPTIPTVGNGKITINQGGVKKGEFTVNQSTDTTINLTDIDTDTQYQLDFSGHTLKLQSKAKGATEWTDVSGQSFELPDTTYEIANATTAGLVKSSTTGTTAGRDYKVQVNTDGTMKVNVPWTDTNTHQSIKTLDTTATAAQDTNASEAIAGSGKITLHKVSKTGNYNDLLNKPTIPTVGNGALTIKVGKNGDQSGTGTFTANQSTAGTITLPVYTKTEVDTMVTGAVQYLGTVSSTTELAALNPDSLGDFCRVSTAFGSYHVGDLLLCKTLKTSSDAATWDVIHGEIDKDTWVANSKIAAGYVAAGGTNANKVWKTDGNGNPGWRDDANTEYSDMKGATASAAGTHGLVPAPAVANRSQFLRGDGTWATPTDTTYVFDGTYNATSNKAATVNTVTNAINNLDVNDISGFGAGKTLKTLTEANGKIAATFQDIRITASQVSDFDTKVEAKITAHSGVDKVGTVTSVSAGVGLKVTGTPSVTPKVEIDEDTTFVFNCGNSSSNW